MDKIFELIEQIRQNLNREQSDIMIVAAKLREVHFAGLADEVEGAVRANITGLLIQLRDAATDHQVTMLRQAEELNNNLLIMLLQNAIDPEATGSLLKNPTAVQIGMMNGAIAKPSVEQIEQVYGRKFEPREIQAGDRVRCVDASGEEAVDLVEGHVYTVVEVKYYIFLKEFPETAWFPKRFELVTGGHDVGI